MRILDDLAHLMIPSNHYEQLIDNQTTVFEGTGWSVETAYRNNDNDPFVMVLVKKIDTAVPFVDLTTRVNEFLVKCKIADDNA